MDIPFATSNVAGVSIARVNAENTLSLSAGNGNSVFVGLVVSARGKPFTRLAITKDNLYKVLGAPIHPSVGRCYEPMRHIEEAVQGGGGYVVRVPSDDARYPVLTWANPAPALLKATTKTAGVKGKTLLKADGDGEGEEVPPVVEPVVPNETATVSYVTKTGMQYGNEPELKDGQLLIIYIVDGDPSTTRSIEFKRDTINSERMFLTLSETSSLGIVSQLETLTVSLSTSVKDDYGDPAWIETALESKSKYLRAISLPDPNPELFKDAIESLTAGPVTFEKGTNGDMNNIGVENYHRALTVLRAEEIYFTAVLSLGCYDITVLGALSDLAKNRRVDAFFDIDPRLSYSDALTTSDEWSFNDHEWLSLYHYPYTYRDKSSRANIVCGISGTAFLTKSKGVQKVPDIGGWHYSAAGEERGVIGRSNQKIASWAGEPDYEAMYLKRLNKTSITRNGVSIIDDGLAAYRRDNDLRFAHVNSTMNAIARDVNQYCQTVKHNPDGITRDSLERNIPKILDGYVTSGALVPPSDPDSNGTDPYIVIISKDESDLWRIDYACCVTGSSRRIAAVPSLIK